MTTETKQIDDSGPAFPGFAYTEGRGPFKQNAQGEWECHLQGMTRRQWLAAIMPCSISNDTPCEWVAAQAGIAAPPMDLRTDTKFMAIWWMEAECALRYAKADAMIAAEKGGQK